MNYHLCFSEENLKYVDNQGYDKIERWRYVTEFDKMYMVSNLGRVKSLPRVIQMSNRKQYIKGRFLKQWSNRQGYLSVTLYKNRDRKNIFTHKLVATYFLKKRHDSVEINHKTGIKTNNSAHSIEWSSRRNNMDHAIKTGLLKNKSAKVWLGKTGKESAFYKVFNQLDKDGNFIKKFYSAAEAGRRLKIDPGSIVKCAKGKVPKAGGFKWEYAKD